TKARLVGLAAARSGVRADRTAARDLASEIEWAKACMVEPADYAAVRAAGGAIEGHADIADQVRGQYKHFVVDEYQDVNPVQQRLLQAWLGERDDGAVGGEARQTTS